MLRIVLCSCLAASGTAVAGNTPIRDSLSFERTDVAVTGVGGIGAAAASGGGEGELVFEPSPLVAMLEKRRTALSGQRDQQRIVSHRLGCFSSVNLLGFRS